MDTRPMGFAKAMVVTAGPLLFTAAVGYDKKWKLTGDCSLEAQLKQCAHNLKAVLKSAGAAPRDVIQLKFYVVNLKPDDRFVIKRAMEQHFYDAKARPTTALLGIAALARPELRVEIELVAALSKARH
jgi:enamine deaminase RidA (YjgF/YER057c/UK114 family)